MVLKPYAALLSEPLSFWVANRDANNVPDTVRAFGLLPVGDDDKMTFFVPDRYSDTFLANLSEGSPVSLMCCSVLTFESYQFKGNVVHTRESTEEEIAMQIGYLDKFAGLIMGLGFSKEDYYNAFPFNVTYAVTFQVTDIFEQTPRKGTGQSVFKKAGA